MNYIQTGFLNIDKSISGLKPGKVYFISALDEESSRGFAASLCDRVNSSEKFDAILYTASPIPYCRCEHIHFANVEEVIEFLRVHLAGFDEYELSQVDVSFFDNYSFLFNALFKAWPPNKTLMKHLYNSYLATIRNLAVFGNRKVQLLAIKNTITSTSLFTSLGS